MSTTREQPVALMPLAIGDHQLAIEALTVLEILGRQQWVAIPNAPPLLPGALAWRGRAIGMFDLGPALDLPALEVPNTRSRNVVVRVAEDTVAVSVEQVLEVCRVPVEAIAPVHATGWIAEGGLPCRGEIELDGRMVAILDLETWARRIGSLAGGLE